MNIDERAAIINEIAAECHKTATEHGFHDDTLLHMSTMRPSQHQVNTWLMLIVSEAAELLEDMRNGADAADWTVDSTGKPVGPAIEFADILIRVFDTMVELGIDVAEVLRVKMAYNNGRPHKHGREF